jgi:hypothetical protein
MLMNVDHRFESPRLRFSYELAGYSARHSTPELVTLLRLRLGVPFYKEAEEKAGTIFLTNKDRASLNKVFDKLQLELASAKM